MKAIFINGSPRKNWNTAQMLDSDMKGAADATSQESSRTARRHSETYPS